MMKTSHKIIIAVVAVFFLIGIIPKIVRFFVTSMSAKEVQYVAIVEKPQISDGIDNLELSGELKPYLQTEIFSRINGLVKNRYVELGQKVKKGQILAEIDTPDLDAEAASAKSALISAEKRLMETKYQYDYASRTYERYKNSAKDGAISTQDLESKYNSYKTSEMNWQGAKADVDKAKEDPIVEGDIIVLTNEYSASASEILVGALKDNGRAKSLGTKTFGKGVIQNVFFLNDGSALKLTVNEYFTPNETKINKVGIAPDYEVELPEDSQEDVQLNKAIELLKKQ